jgi:hypothetical protein
MQTLPKQTGRQRTRGWRFRGITKHAQRLGLSRVHLYFVLTGVRPMTARVHAYLKEHAQDALSASGCQASAKGKFFASGADGANGEVERGAE